MSDGGALQTFVAKWYRHEPEMQAGETFAGARAAQYRAWGALQSELLDAIFGIEEAAVARTKLAWWGEDLARGAAAGHPVARALHAADAVPAMRWRVLAQAALALRDVDASPRDGEAARAALQPLADALAAIERHLFGGADAAQTIVANLAAACLRRALATGRPEHARLPLSLLAEHQASWSSLEALRADAPLPPVLRAHAGDIARRCAPVRALTVLRGLRTHCDRVQLDRLQRGVALQAALRLSPWRALWSAWTSARHSVRPPAG